LAHWIGRNKKAVPGKRSFMTVDQPGKFYFTVGQLVEILKALPPDLPVLTSGYKSGYDNFYHPEVVKMKRGLNDWYEYGEFEVAGEGDIETFDAVLLSRVVRDD